MKQIISLVFFFSLVSGIYSQTLYTRTDTLTITGDTVTFQAGKFRGTIQWQHSLDGQTWDNLAGKTDTLLPVSAKNEGFYRAEVTDEACNPVYSDTAQIKNGYEITKYIFADTGDTIRTPDSSILILPPGSLSINGNVTISNFTENALPENKSENISYIGKTYRITFSGDTLLNSCQFTFTLDSVPESFENMVLFIYNGKSFFPIEYSVNDNIVTANIDKISWQSFQTDTTASLKNIKLFSEIILSFLVWKQTPPVQEMGLKEITSSGKNLYFSPPSSISDTSKVLLLVHGWNDKPQTWANFVQFVTSQTDIKFDKIWTFGYNSSWSINANAFSLAEALASYTHGAKVKIVAHSMGGLVSRSMIENYNGAKHVKKLVTLGTPHLGSPLGLVRNLINMIISLEILTGQSSLSTMILYNEFTQGFRDLYSDSEFINLMKQHGQAPLPYYAIAATSKINDPSVIEEYNDGVVPLSSALGAPTLIASSVYTLPFLAHFNLLSDYNVFNKTKEYLKDDFTLKVVQGDKQTGVAGKPLALPIIIQVLDEIEKPVKGAKVYFESEFSPGKYLTIDSRDDGKVAVEWTLDSIEGIQKVNVFLTDDSGKKIEKSALVITAECKIDAPTITTYTVSNITETSAFGGGNITDDGGAEITARGICWNTTGAPTIDNSKTNNGAGIGAFTSGLSGLAEGTTYYVRAYATNSKGTAYGNEVSFTTPSAITITTANVSNITANSATCGGTITSNKTITARGVCWNTTGNPTISDSKTSDGSGTGSFTSSLTGLTANTAYYVRAYATTIDGTMYGNQVSFKTGTIQICDCDKKYGMFTDSRDGHVYKSIQIGDKTWMAENLAYLPYLTSYCESSYTTACYYLSPYGENDEHEYNSNPKSTYFYKNYGVLYNLSAALSACPEGWHLPSMDEWISLFSSIEDANDLRDVRLWKQDLTATNKSCFSALPAGICGGNCGFNKPGNEANFWACDKKENANSNKNEVGNNAIIWVNGAQPKSYWYGFLINTNNGLSVRCIKD